MRWRLTACALFCALLEVCWVYASVWVTITLLSVSLFACVCYLLHKRITGRGLAPDASIECEEEKEQQAEQDECEPEQDVPQQVHPVREQHDAHQQDHEAMDAYPDVGRLMRANRALIRQSEERIAKAMKKVRESEENLRLCLMEAGMGELVSQESQGFATLPSRSVPASPARSFSNQLGTEALLSQAPSLSPSSLGWGDEERDGIDVHSENNPEDEKSRESRLREAEAKCRELQAEYRKSEAKFREWMAKCRKARKEAEEKLKKLERLLAMQKARADKMKRESIDRERRRAEWSACLRGLKDSGDEQKWQAASDLKDELGPEFTQGAVYQHHVAEFEKGLYLAERAISLAEEDLRVEGGSDISADILVELCGYAREGLNMLQVLAGRIQAVGLLTPADSRALQDDAESMERLEARCNKLMQQLDDTMPDPVRP